jgi:hypothetical protein
LAFRYVHTEGLVGQRLCVNCRLLAVTNLSEVLGRCVAELVSSGSCRACPALAKCLTQGVQ